MSHASALAKSFLRKQVTVVFDRPLKSKHPNYGFVYELNYGFIPNTLAPDGEALDAYYLGSNQPLVLARGVCKAFIHRKADDDDKLIVMPEKLELSDSEIMRLVAFQEQFFESSIIR